MHRVDACGSIGERLWDQPQGRLNRLQLLACIHTDEADKGGTQPIAVV